ncbi:MAG: glycosyltransferase family 2 protein [Candidatus Omnitrophota bacterium]
MEPEISVVILCYKSGRQVYDFFERTMHSLREAIPLWEIILVGNYFENTDDDTPRIVNEIALKFEQVRAITLPKEGMMGWDARTGLNAARGKYICLIDGDDQMSCEDIIRVYKKIKEEKSDFVQTYRAKRHDGFRRKMISLLYNKLFQILFPGTAIKDVNSKPKIFTKVAYEKMHLLSNDWFLDAEIIIQARKLKLKMAEVPTVFRKCKYRKSFVKSSAIFEFLRNLFLARIRYFFKEDNGKEHLYNRCHG